MNSSVKDARQIEREADQTREAMAETLDALQRKLSPGELLDRGLGYMREHGGEFAAHLGNDVKDNPLPTLLVGAGLAWMMASGRRPDAPIRYGSDLRPAARGSLAAGNGQPQGSGKGMKQAAHSAAESVQDRAHAVGNFASEHYAEARAGFSHMLEEQPLFLGGLAFAIGAALGAAAPGTRKEEEAVNKFRRNGGEATDDFSRRAGSDESQPPGAQRRSFNVADEPDQPENLTSGVNTEPAFGGTRVEREAIVDLGGPRPKDPLRGDDSFDREHSRDRP